MWDCGFVPPGAQPHTQALGPKAQTWHRNTKRKRVHCTKSGRAYQSFSCCFTIFSPRHSHQHCTGHWPYTISAAPAANTHSSSCSSPAKSTRPRFSPLSSEVLVQNTAFKEETAFRKGKKKIPAEMQPSAAACLRQPHLMWALWARGLCRELAQHPTAPHHAEPHVQQPPAPYLSAALQTPTLQGWILGKQPLLATCTQLQCCSPKRMPQWDIAGVWGHGTPPSLPKTCPKPPKNQHLLLFPRWICQPSLPTAPPA